MSRRRKLRNQWENNAATTHFSWVVAQNLVSWKLSWQDWQMLSFNISLQFNGSALFKKKKKNTFYLTITLNFPNNLDTCTSALEKYIYSHNWYHRALKSDTSSVQHSSDSNVSFGRVETFTVDFLLPKRVTEVKYRLGSTVCMLRSQFTKNDEKPHRLSEYRHWASNAISKPRQTKHYCCTDSI